MTTPLVPPPLTAVAVSPAQLVAVSNALKALGDALDAQAWESVERAALLRAYGDTLSVIRGTASSVPVEAKSAPAYEVVIRRLTAPNSAERSRLLSLAQDMLALGQEQGEIALAIELGEQVDL